MFRALTSRVGSRTLAMRALPAQSGSRTAAMATSREQFLEDYGSVDNGFEKDRVPKTGDDSQRAFAYMVLSGGRFVYASAARLAVLKVVSTMSASADVLALASLEVDLSPVHEGTTVTVKWRGKPVFVRHRTPAEISGEETVAVNSLRDPESDGDRCKKPEWMIVLGVCTHLGCVPISNAGEYHGWFCPCHGSHYDTAGRIRKGPAPLNLEVPPYKFLEENKLLLG